MSRQEMPRTEFSLPRPVLRMMLGLVGLVGLGAAWGLSPLMAAELVMFERAGCVWCARWEQEIGPIYPKTEEGRRLPLRKLDIGAPLPAGVALVAPLRYTPTFVVLDEGREIGRITGYIGEYAFWGLLSGLMSELPANGQAPGAGRVPLKVK
jgi:hypothetical protein